MGGRGESRWAALLDELEDLTVLELDGDLRVVEVSGAGFERAGWGREEVVGRLALDVSGDLAAAFEPGLHGALAGRSTTIRVTGARSGHPFVARVVPDGDGGVLMIMRDASLEAERAEAELRFRAWFDGAAAGAVMTSVDGKLMEVNEAFAAMLGYTRDELQGRSVAGITHADDVSENQDHMRRHLSGAGDSSPFETRYRHRDGHVVHALLSSAVIRDPAGVPLYFSTQIIDVSARRAAEQAAAEQTALVTGVIEHNVALIYVKDLEGRYLLYNQPFADAFALDQRGAVEGKSGREVLLGRDDSWLAPELAAGWRENDLRAREASCRVEEYADHPTRGRVYYDSIKFPIAGPDGAVSATCGVSRDITERRHVELERAAAEARFRSAFDCAPIGMALLTLDGCYEEVNDALCTITGLAREELVGQPALERLAHPRDREQTAVRFRELLAGDERSITLELRYLHDSGQSTWISIAGTVVRDHDETPLHLLAQVQDITQKREFEHQLQHMAMHDPLTGLLNRRAFEEHLDRAAASVERYGPEGALLMIDLDNFKLVNDTLGHNAGDQLIVSVAGLLKERLRDTDLIARLGGDEFAILLPKAGAEQAANVAATLLAAIRAHTMQLAGVVSRQITASCGIALIDGDVASGEHALVNADLAMYDAKEAGRDRTGQFSNADHAEPRTKARMGWLTRIEDALESDKLELFAQPIVDLHSDHLHRLELLLRMRTDDGDLIPPGAFLYVADRFDLMPAIDRWVIGQAVRISAEHPGLGLALNISAKSIGDARVLAHLRAELARHEIDASALCFEMTETSAVANVPKARRFAEEVGALGGCFALDDFGAGFGSFYYLKHLPFDYVKIDGEFISNCVANHTDQLVVQAVVTTAQGLGKQTVAEFVGDEATVRFLRRHGVEHGQGYHLGQPIPINDALANQNAVLPRSRDQPELA